MARTGKGILDGFRGSIAQTTGSRDKGKDVIRTKPRNTPKTQTPGLISSKNNFATLMLYWKILKEQPASQAWKTKRMSEHNKFIQYNTGRYFYTTMYEYTDGVQLLPNGEPGRIANITGNDTPGWTAYNIFKREEGIPANFPLDSPVICGVYFSQDNTVQYGFGYPERTLGEEYAAQIIKKVISGSIVIPFCAAFNLEQNRNTLTAFTRYDII